MDKNCVYKEKIIRTFHDDEKCKDYMGGLCKYSGNYMREMVFQNDKYKYTKISINPYWLLFGNKYEIEELYELPYETVEKLCNESALKDFDENDIIQKTEKIIKDTPKKQLINILEGYNPNDITISKDGRIRLPKIL